MSLDARLPRPTVLLLLPLLLSSVAALGREPMSLAEALAYALDHNPRIAAAAARVSGAEASVALAGSGAKPVVRLTASERLQGPLQEIRIPIPGQERTIRINRAQQASVGVGVAWPLWTGGRTQAALGAARAQVGAAEADLHQATEQLLYEVGAGYYRVLSARAAGTAADAALQHAEESLRTARVARDAGALTEAELAAAEATQRQAVQARAAAQNAVADAEQALNRLLGRPQAEPVLIVDAPVALQEPAGGEEAIRIALATRPELLALEHRREAAEAAIAVARAERNPTISLTGQAAKQTATEVVKGHSESIGLEFSWPIFASAPRAQEEGARATVREVEETRRDLQSAIRLQVAEAERRLSDARGSLSASEDAVRAAEEAAREADVSYQAGAITRQQRVAAESALRDARARRSEAEDRASVALLSYVRALGLMRAVFVAPAEEAGV